MSSGKAISTFVDMKRLAAAAIVAALSIACERGFAQDESDLAILTVPASKSIGTCSADGPPGGDPSMGGWRRFELKINAQLRGARTIGIAIDSAGFVRAYTESAVAMVNATEGESRTVVASVSPSGVVKGFASRVRAGQRGADSIKPGPGARTPLDSLEQRAVLRVAEWARSRCVPR